MDAKELRRVLDFARMKRTCHVDWVEGRRAEECVVADAIAAEVARAVAEERERAAQVAETYEGCRLPGTTCAGCPADGTWDDGACVAQNIRACVGGKEEGR